MRLTIAALMLLATPALADTPPASPAEKKICRTEQPTGSIFAKRARHTRAEWDKLNGAGRVERERDQGPLRGDGVRPAD